MSRITNVVEEEVNEEIEEELEELDELSQSSGCDGFSFRMRRDTTSDARRQVGLGY